MSDAFFSVRTRDDDQEILHPMPASASGWSHQQVRGPAVCAALARTTERVATLALPDHQPVRWTVDLFRPAAMLPTLVTTSIVRQGRRIGLIDAEMVQNGRQVARSRALFARPSSTPEARVWKPSINFVPPPVELLPLPGETRLYNSGRRGWTAHIDGHLNDEHKQTWHFPLQIVEGEEATRFQIAAAVADITNLVMSWGSAGVEFINADVTLAITRLSTDFELGLCALDRTVVNGIAVGTAAMFDRQGQLGIATVVSLANPGKRVPGRRP